MEKNYLFNPQLEAYATSQHFTRTKRIKNSQKQQKKGEKVSAPLKSNFFRKNFILLFFAINLFRKILFQKLTNRNKYIKTTKFLKKHVISTPLNSTAFKGSQ